MPSTHREKLHQGQSERRGKFLQTINKGSEPKHWKPSIESSSFPRRLLKNQMNDQNCAGCRDTIPIYCPKVVTPSTQKGHHERTQICEFNKIIHMLSLALPTSNYYAIKCQNLLNSNVFYMITMWPFSLQSRFSTCIMIVWIR